MTAQSGPNAVPDRLDDVPNVVEFGGAIGRTATAACKQGQHDLCTDEACQCRHHGRVAGDVTYPRGEAGAIYPCRFCPDTVTFDNCWRHTSDQSIIRTVWNADQTDCAAHRATPDLIGEVNT